MSRSFAKFIPDDPFTFTVALLSFLMLLTISVPIFLYYYVRNGNPLN